MADVVINAAGVDQAIAGIVAKQLDVFGLSSWCIPSAAIAGTASEDVRTQIDAASAVLTLWTTSSCRSAKVLEWSQVADSQHKLLNTVLDDCKPPIALANQDAVDISGWVQDRSPLEFEQLRVLLLEMIEETRLRADSRRVDVYVGYSSLDRERAQSIATVLRDAGYSVWIDADIAPGQDWRDEIRRSFEAAKCVLALVSRRSVQSAWVQMYFEKALAKGILIPVLIEPIPSSELPAPFDRLEACDLSAWQGLRGGRDLEELLFRTAAMVGPLRPRPLATPGPKIGGRAARRREGYDVFVSYKTEDRPKIGPFVEQVKHANLSIWWDQMIPQGANWGFSIDNALLVSRSVIVFWTPQSVKSEEVYSEAEHGLRMNALFPILLEECAVPPRMCRIQWIDLTAPAVDRGPLFDNLLGSVKRRIRAP